MKRLFGAAAVILMALPSVAVGQMSQQMVQVQQQNWTQTDYEQRLRAAKTPEERGRIQAEYDRQMQQGAMPSHDHNDTRVQTAPGTAGSGTLPSTEDHGPRAGETPGSGGGVPHGQGGE